ncbi:nipped-B B isoform X2 [Micractinium conductrix]|uniref:Sister chromatid cohesion protein n=1 Tax=Micractinium conductrix TaxID=554055 RepID=A0A2P6V4I4_9CHLO|nr:nipped-B B isoform X2 [Micractinium conductrix]|eukprot:PSC68988.1 nipped-B B isoform X2 [Micractinium conductrix]
MADGQEPQAHPILRWPSLLHPQPSLYLGFPTPAAPTSGALVGGLDAGHALSESALAGVISLLAPVDVGYLRPLAHAPPVGAGEPRSVLCRQLSAAAPGIFAAAPTSHVLPPAQAQPTAAVPPAAAQPAAEQPAAAHPGRRRAADGRKPAAKRARVAAVAEIADRATALETPAEEAAKAADAYTTCIREFVKKHEKAAAEAAGVEADRERSAKAEGSEDEEEEEDQQEAAAADSGVAAATLLRDARGLGEETARMCRPELQQALRGGGVPLDDLLRLLRLLHRLAAAGTGRLLEPGDTEASPHAQRILAAMEAAGAALHLMTVPDMPQRVYSEDAAEAVLDLLRFQLTYNVYPFHDARLRSATRPKLAAAGEAAAAAAEEAATAKGKRRPAKKALSAVGVSVPPVMRVLLDRAQGLLVLLSQLLAVLRLPGAALLPLLRACGVSLTVEGQKLLQEKAARLLVAAFKAYPAQWGTMIDELFAHVIPHLPSGPKAPRDFPAAEDAGGGGAAAAGCHIQMITAALLQMIQACVDLPAVDCEPGRLADCYKGAATCADYFWSCCFDRLPAARAAKSEGDADFRTLLQGLLRDLLAAAHLPAWPAAPFLLLRFAAVLGGDRGLRHPDQHVRQYCLDLAASLAAQLYRDEVAVGEDAAALVALAARDAEGSGDPSEEAPRLLLLFLADRRRAAHASASSARTFMLCQAFAEEVTNLQKQDAGPEEFTAKLVQYRQRRDELDGLGADVAVTPEDGARLARFVVQSTLGRARQSMLQWLLECMGPSCASTTRAKAVKALGEVLQADSRVLESNLVQSAVDKALQDEAISVREAAVSLLGRHVGHSQALALRLFPTLARASTDPGTSVRKAAIKILWDACIRQPGFPRATDACKHVLMRSADQEESIQDMVAKVFHSLWFTPRLEVAEGEGGAPVERSAAERAEQLADVALAVYEAGGRAIHLPLDQAHPLVAVLRAALGVGARGDLKKEWKAGREVASALLDLFLTAEETSQAGEHAGFKHLLSLHAFAVTDVELCQPPSDPAKFVRSLAPYLKASDAGGQSEAARRRGAESLLCVLSVAEAVLSQQRHCEAATLGELLADLQALVNRHPYVQVLAGACACLTTLALKEEAAARQLASLAGVFAGWLREPQGGAAAQPAFMCRFLFILGQLCRRGAALLQATPPEGGGPPLSMAECQRLFVEYCSPPRGRDPKVAEAGLGALGMLAIARPAIMVDKRSPASKILKAALQPNAPELLKLKAVSNLIELLRADEVSMRAAQADGGEGGGAAHGAPPTVGGGKRRGKKGGAAAAAAADDSAQRAALQTQNGEGDTLSQSSSILQDNWEAVLVLATDTTPSPPGSALSPPGSADGELAPGTHVRRRVVELMEIVIRGGLVGPWTAVAPLMALCTDPHEDIRSRALRLLRHLCEKFSRYLDADRLCSGVVEAYRFRAALAEAAGEPTAQRGWAEGAPPQALAGLSAVYAALIQPKFQLKVDFLRGLLKRLRAGADLVAASGGAAGSELRLLDFCAAVVAALPYKRGDEPCMVVQEINGIVCRSGEGVKEEFKRSLFGAISPGAPGAVPGSNGAASAAVMALCKASLALSMLLLLKEYIKTAYSINSERIEAFAKTGEKRKAEEKLPVAPLAGVPTHLDKLQLGAHRDPEQMRAQYKVFKQLMARDSADYGHLVAAPKAAKGGVRGGEEADGAPDAAGGDGGSPGGAAGEEDDRTPGWVEGLGRAPAGAKTGRGRGRGSAGGRGRGSTGGRGRGAATGGRGGRRKRRKGGSSEESGGEESEGEYAPAARAKSTRKAVKRLPMTED